MPNSYPTPNEANKTSMASLGHTHPGKVTRGPGSNKPRIHLVSSKGKIPAAVYAAAIAHKQASKQEGRTHIKLPNQTHSLSPANVHSEQLKNPSGVAKRPAPKHQNNPAFAGRFTPQGRKYN